MLLNTWNRCPPETLAVTDATPKATTIRRLLKIEVRHRLTVVLIFTVILLCLLPFIRGDEVVIFWTKLVFFAILLFAISGGHRRGRDLIVAGGLGIPVMGSEWLSQHLTDIRVPLVIDGLRFVFLLYIAIVILNQVFSARRVTLDTIAGALCTYLLIGLAGAFVYRAMFEIRPHSFLVASGSAARMFETNSPSQPQLMNFVYYSFTTLTTTGFGDITPSSGPSRMVSLLEAIAGQFFLAVLIARLVSLELLHSTRGDGE